MTRDDDEPAQAPLRPLDLDPERAARLLRAPYGIVDIGSNSVRLVVYDQLSRAPLPRFNEKLLCRLGENLAETGEINPESFGRTVNALRRFRAVADAMGVVKLDVTGTEAIRIAKNGAALAEAIRAETGLQVRILSGAEEAHYSALGVISGFFRPIGVVGDMGGGSLEVAEALDDKVGDRWVSLPLGALPVEKMLADGVQSAKRAIDAMLKERLPPVLAQPAFYAVGGGWRTFAKAHMAATGAPVRVTHGYTIAASEARNYARTLMSLPAEKLAATEGVSERRARTTPAAAVLLDRVLKRLAPERVVFSALGLREGLLYSQLSRAEQYFDPLVEGAQLIGLPQARVPDSRPRWCAGRTFCFRAKLRRRSGLRVAVSALSDISWRLPPDVRAEEAFVRVLRFPFIGVDHAERAFLAAAISARYAGRPDERWLFPAINLLSAALRRRSQILGRALLLAYRISSGVPKILDDARLRIEADCVRVEVSAAARALDSEIVGDRLRLFASAVGARRAEIVVKD